jgi:hypothetical protein
MNHQPLTLIINPQPRLNRSRRVKASHGFFAQKKSQFFIGAYMQNHSEIAQKTPKKPCKFAPKTMPITLCSQFINKSHSCFFIPMDNPHAGGIAFISSEFKF